jgi:tetratricopeptide (TPR) repeat protein
VSKRPNPQKVAPPVAKRAGLLPWLVFLGLALLLYGNTIGHGYVLDDGIVITKDQFTQQGLKGIPDILTTDAFTGFFGKNKDLVSGGRYRPLSIVTFAIEQEFIGGNPHVSHFINILLYGVTGALMFILLGRLLKSPAGGSWWLGVPFIASALFIAHPVHTEVAANIKGRDEILCLLFCLLTVILLLEYFSTGKTLYALLSPVVFFLALLSKENAITFLAVIPLALYFFTGAAPKKIALGVAPLAAVALVFLVLRAHFAGSAESGDITEVLNNAFVYADPSQKFATIASILGKYLLLLVFPHPLTHDYYYNQIPIIGWDNPGAIIPLAVYLALGAWALAGIRKKRLVAFGILYYFATLSVVSNIFIPVGTTMSERFLYLPSVGFTMILAYSLTNLSGIVSAKTSIGARPVLTGLLALLLAACGLKTIMRNPAWKDNYTLFATDVFSSPNSAKVHNALGGELVRLSADEPDPVRKRQMLDQALQNLRRAVEIHPTYSEPWFSMGNIYYQRDTDVQESIECYRKAIEARPGYTDAYKNLSVVYLHAKQYDNAIGTFRKLTNVDPGNDDAYYQMGLIHLSVNRADSAIRDLKQAIALNPVNAPAYSQLGMIYGREKQELDTAIFYLQKAVSADPSGLDGYNNLGTAYALKREYDAAIGVFRRALDLSPQDTRIYLNLGLAYQSKGDTNEAKRCFEKVRELSSRPRGG